MQKSLQFSIAAESICLACLDLQQVEALAVVKWRMEMTGILTCASTSTSRHVVPEVLQMLMVDLQTASTTIA